MEAKHSWNGVGLMDCGDQDLASALQYGQQELERIDAIDTSQMPVKRKDRLAKSRDEISAFVDAVREEQKLRADAFMKKGE
ncbi:MAG: hypothetical protein E6R03_01540 [Hyphomicrobiaceae bacterium]|nr:MAG: hypothetical protein E6R03_01540 [Hyphomicrobiaceae bacterium]